MGMVGGLWPKFSDPGTTPTGQGNGVAFSPDGGAIAVAHNTSPYVTAYPWSSGFGTKVTNPGTLPTGNGNAVAFAPNGNSIAVAHATTPFVSAYPWSGSFRLQVLQPATFPAVRIWRGFRDNLT